MYLWIFFASHSKHQRTLESCHPTMHSRLAAVRMALASCTIPFLQKKPREQLHAQYALAERRPKAWSPERWRTQRCMLTATPPGLD